MFDYVYGNYMEYVYFVDEFMFLICRGWVRG